MKPRLSKEQMKEAIRAAHSHKHKPKYASAWLRQGAKMWIDANALKWERDFLATGLHITENGERVSAAELIRQACAPLINATIKQIINPPAFPKITFTDDNVYNTEPSIKWSTKLKK